MQHRVHTEHEIFGKIHSFSGVNKEIYDLIRILIHEGVSFRFTSSDLDHGVVSHITDPFYQMLVKKGRLIDPTSD